MTSNDARAGSDPLDLSKLDQDDLVSGFARHLGLEVTHVSPDLVQARWTAAEALADQAGNLHRGAHSSVIETLASIAAAVWLGESGKVVGVNNNTDFFESGESGSFTSTATPVHRDHDQQLWLVETTDAPGVVVARGQVRLQNLYPRD